MPLINFIPEKYEDGFQELGTLDEEQFTALRDVLSNAPLVSSLEKLKNVLPVIPELELVDVEEILSSVGSIIAFLEEKEMIEEIIKDIVSLCEDSELIELEKREDFATRLNYLVNNKQIYYASKASSLVNSYTNVFLQSKIISDIRPIFDIDVNDSIQAGVVLHNLSIHYKSNEEPFHKDITITLDYNDLITLKEVIVRAEHKAMGLKKIFDKAEMKNLSE